MSDCVPAQYWQNGRHDRMRLCDGYGVRCGRACGGLEMLDVR